MLHDAISPVTITLVSAMLVQWDGSLLSSDRRFDAGYLCSAQRVAFSGGADHKPCACDSEASGMMTGWPPEQEDTLVEQAWLALTPVLILLCRQAAGCCTAGQHDQDFLH